MEYSQEDDRTLTSEVEQSFRQTLGKQIYSGNLFNQAGGLARKIVEDQKGPDPAPGTNLRNLFLESEHRVYGLLQEGSSTNILFRLLYATWLPASQQPKYLLNLRELLERENISIEHFESDFSFKKTKENNAIFSIKGSFGSVKTFEVKRGLRRLGTEDKVVIRFNNKSINNPPEWAHEYLVVKLLREGMGYRDLRLFYSLAWCDAIFAHYEEQGQAK